MLGKAGERWEIGIDFVPNDIWVGVYWRVDPLYWKGEKLLKVWVCLIPMLPIYFVLAIGEEKNGTD
jgi:hypothetical protein